MYDDYNKKELRERSQILILKQTEQMQRMLILE